MNASFVLSASFQFDCTLTSAFVAILFSLARSAEVKSSVDKPLPATLSSLVAIVVFRLAMEALLALYNLQPLAVCLKRRRLIVILSL